MMTVVSMATQSICPGVSIWAQTAFAQKNETCPFQARKIISVSSRGSVVG
jgi:hypothetical protein